MPIPRFDVMGRKNVIFVRIDHVGVIEKQEGEGAACAAGIDRLPKPVENEDGSVQGGTHKTPTLAIQFASSNKFGDLILVRITKIYGKINEGIAENPRLMVSRCGYMVNNPRIPR